MVPMAVPGLVRCSSLIMASAVALASVVPRLGSTVLAKPKSRILDWPRAVMKMLAGLMSR